MLVALLVGFLFGFIGSIPVAGPISAIVLKKGLTGEFRSAMLVGAGGAIAEAIYAFLAFYGFSNYLSQYPLLVPISQGLAALILVGLGVSFVRYRVKDTEDVAAEKQTALRNFSLGFTITILNPTLIATWTAAANVLFSTQLIQFSPAHALPFSAGCLVGIAGWFVAFSLGLRKYGNRFSKARLAMVVRVIGGAILILGLWFAVRFIRGMLAKS